MLINARQNSFFFQFPKGFFSKSLEDKYLGYVKRMPIPYETLRDFMNSTIQQITFPSFQAIDNVQQTRPGGFKQSYKSSTTLQNLLKRQFTVTFKLGEGFINYWIMYDCIVNFLDFNNPDEYLPDMNLRLLDNEGVVMATLTFQQSIFTSLSEVQLNYASTTPQFSTFQVGFQCNYVETKLEIG
jgi:hypothetical protein